MIRLQLQQYSDSMREFGLVAISVRVNFCSAAIHGRCTAVVARPGYSATLTLVQSSCVRIVLLNIKRGIWNAS